jgi:lipoyl-dependent peroxiredoxin
MTTFSRRAELRWQGDLVTGSGEVTGGTGAFAVPVRFPSVAGDPPGKTTPEELLAASHAACYGIGLRSLIGRRGGKATRITVEAIITAEKGPTGIEISSSHLAGVIGELEHLDDTELRDVAREVAEGCTISAALRGTVRITHDIKASRHGSKRVVAKGGAALE